MYWYIPPSGTSEAGNSYTITVTATAGCGGGVTETVSYVLNISGAGSSCDSTEWSVVAPALKWYSILAPGTTPVATPVAPPAVTASGATCTVTLVLEIDATGSGSYTEVTTDSLFLANFDAVDKDFDILTNDQSYINEVYPFRYVWTDDATSPKIVTETFSVTFESACWVDSLAWDLTGRTNIDHTLGNSDPAISAVAYTQSVTNCPITIVTEWFNDGTSAWEAYTNWEPTFFGSYDAATGAFSPDSTGFDTAPYLPVSVVQLRVVVTSTLSTELDGSFTDEFTITLLGSCAEEALTRGGEIADQTYVDSQPALEFQPPYTYSGDATTCPLTAVLSIHDGAGWVVYDAANPDHAWVNAFADGSAAPFTDAAELSIEIAG